MVDRAGCSSRLCLIELQPRPRSHYISSQDCFQTESIASLVGDVAEKIKKSFCIQREPYKNSNRKQFTFL